MTDINIAIYDAFREAGVEENTARRAAAAMSGHADLDRRLTRFEDIVDDIRQRIIKMERDMRLHWWAFGILIATQAAILIKLFHG